MSTPAAKPAPTLTEIMETLTFFTDTVRLVHLRPGRPFPVPQVHHKDRLDATLRIIGSIHVSPELRILLAEKGILTPEPVTPPAAS